MVLKHGPYRPYAGRHPGATVHWLMGKMTVVKDRSTNAYNEQVCCNQKEHGVKTICVSSDVNNSGDEVLV
jgi:hypothetical protein